MEPLYPQILVGQIEFLFLEGAVSGTKRGAKVVEVSYHESQSLGKVFFLPDVIFVACARGRCTRVFRPERLQCTRFADVLSLH
jgi:hypothetical protein